MIDRQGGKIVFECDCCPEVFESGSADFNAAWTAAKAEGWRSNKVGEDWLHSCGSAKCKIQ